ncbi:MAG: transcriptional repressor [Burkholderiaceae bacterium]|nr:transcriptional repressor [Burkholderiaceae bacterium]
MERHTRQRQAVLDALARSGQALSPQDLLTQAKSVVPRLNLSTVYRQIKDLQDAGQIVRVELPGQPPRFEMASRGESAAPAAHRHESPSVSHSAHSSDEASRHHHHFHCVQCDRVYPIHACPGPMNDLAPPGFEVQHHDLTLRGRCASCVAGASA